MIGRVVEFLWMLTFWFFVISVFLFPISLAYWHHNEKQRAKDTEETLKTLGFDTSGEHIYDA